MISFKKKEKKEVEPITELEVQEIENRIVSKKLKVLTGVPREIRQQLSRMKEDVLRIWGIDTVYAADIQIKMFQAVANSVLTLDLLDVLIRKHGESMSKMSFDRFLKRMAKRAKSYQKKENKESDIHQNLKDIISGKVK